MGVRMAWWNDNLLFATGQLYTRLLQEARGIGFAERVLNVQQLGHPLVNVYRSYALEDLAIQFDVALSPNADDMTAEALGTLTADWHNWHKPSNGQKVLRILMDSGNQYAADAVALTAKIERQGPREARVIQQYLAGTPFWRSIDESSASANFDGATPVTLTVVNAGTEPAWLRFVIMGAVNVPKLVLGDYEIELNLELSAGDQLDVNTKSPISVQYTPSAGSAVNAYGYRTEATDIVPFMALVGSNSITLTATGGTGTCTAYWYNWYGAPS
jgi:hypothetical protein